MDTDYDVIRAVLTLFLGFFGGTLESYFLFVFKENAEL